MQKKRLNKTSAGPESPNLLTRAIQRKFTADNLDYVLRDSYMCGVAVGPVDLSRLIHYTMITAKGFTIHKTGLPALQMRSEEHTSELQSRLHLVCRLLLEKKKTTEGHAS